MTVTNVPCINQVTATAGQTVIPFTFPIRAATDMVVYKTLAAQAGNDVNDILATNTYTVAININFIGGTVTLNTGAAVGDRITMLRDMPDERSTTFQNAAIFQAASVNLEWDTDVLLIQQNSLVTQARGLRYNFSESITTPRDTNIPKMVALQSFRMNAAGTGWEAYTPAVALPELRGDGLVTVNTAELITSITLLEATSEEMEEGISDAVAVTPAALQYSPFVNTALIYKDVSGVKTRNCIAVKAGVGLWTVTFIGASAANNRYIVNGSANNTVVDATNPLTFGTIVAFNKLNTGFSFYVLDANNTRRDLDGFEIAVCGMFGLV